ncbi:MAG: HAMP domain-containing protein [Anaerolineae bacterium]|nr:HAMP domain-containing protein [Anaerolineae bacterium]
MKSLSLKLTLAFLLVSLIVAGLAAVFTWQATAREFETLVVDRIRDDFTEKVINYYHEHGSLQGIREVFPPPVQPQQTLDPNQPKPAPIVFALTNANGVVVIPAGKYRPRQNLPPDILAEGTPIDVDGLLIGTVLLTGNLPEFSPVEERYLERTNQALLLATGTATIIALVLGALLARSMTRPLRELTSATRAVARGDLEQKIPVRSQDELGELVESFNQMSADLAQATESRRQMTADIAHDLGSPLTVIGGYLEAMQEGVLEVTPERIGVMNTEITHLQHLVRDLRTLSLADAGQMSLNRNQVEMGALLRRVAASYQLAAKQKGIHLSVEAESAPLSIEIDEERMAQALGNLVSNALRYTAEGGAISIQFSVVSGGAVIAVEDNGAGIAEAGLIRIFERFYRADQARNLEAGESGLGLAITRAIVEAHGGQISVKSKLGEGTRFEIRLKV